MTHLFKRFGELALEAVSLVLQGAQRRLLLVHVVAGVAAVFPRHESRGRAARLVGASGVPELGAGLCRHLGLRFELLPEHLSCVCVHMCVGAGMGV